MENNGNGDQNGRTRNRGVRASRLKLEKALAESDLDKKTQAALANRIADLEELDAAPKDLVSKVFRELPVAPQTIERIARALGVEAASLYLTEEDEHLSPPPSSHPVPPPPVPTQTAPAWFRPIALWPTALLMVAIVAIVFTVRAFSPNSDLTCRVNEFFTPLHTPPGRLGVIIARFGNDPENRGQRMLTREFLKDAKLSRYVTVLQACDRPSLSGPGDISARLEKIRGDGRQKLTRTGAHILIWGQNDGDRLQVRFISPGTGISPVSLDIGGRPTQIAESQLTIPLEFDQPDDTLPDIKKIALELMTPETDDLRAVRQEAVRSYQASMEWLRASILGDRNVKRTINPKTDPQLWALLNGQLCYKQRLLGDYDADLTQYLEAEQSCRDALEVRDKQQYPRDWASLKINLASTLIRQHLYADSPEKSRELLRQAETVMLEAAEVLDEKSMPQLWALQKRNMGVVYMRLGELSEGDEAEYYFDRGLESMQAALTVLRPEFQPVDWALTQQNICLSLYRKGYNRGTEGIPLVHLAGEHCREALRWLDPEKTGLTWAMVQNNLAVSLAILSQLEGKPDQLAAAIDEFSKAQTVYTRERFPANWAEVEINLGELNCNLAVLRRDAAYLEEAITHSEQALQVLMSKKLGRYQTYLEGLLKTYKACQQEDISKCSCSPAQ
ncbi:hypothetical protein [Emcibacter nanhaiensis]|uniref:Tetratricopeptide repeat protein n=1 Tax=Emcibacter nanhaiensis TaxID=1505037 RepID=A0A501PBW8_9PROT|nr:hypothetical protein [Emcibacter nanhaiensis]TPD57899.1 hypothetical protein FIV46_17530 [Emcibacter nanhaiensis]